MKAIAKYKNQEITFKTFNNPNAWQEGLVLQDGTDTFLIQANDGTQHLDSDILEFKFLGGAHEKTIWTLDLHETLAIETASGPLTATAVPGGWIYTSWIGGESISTTYVPDPRLKK